MKKVIGALLSGIYLMSAVGVGSQFAYAAEAENAGIIVDGDVSEWEAVESLEVSDGSVDQWKLVQSDDGSTLYMAYSGVAMNQWDQAYIWDMVTITYENGTVLKDQPVNYLVSGWIKPGGQMATTNGARGNSPGNYGVELALPMPDGDFSVTFAGTTISKAEIPDFVSAEEVEYAYEGITIDGKYRDWRAVGKTEVQCPNAAHYGECLESVACVFDGDYIYLYLKDGENSSADGAGMASNGKYSITTDTGRQLVFQLLRNQKGTARIGGIEEAEVICFGGEWEIAIPVSLLPEWKEGISFGLYQEEPFVTGVVDLQGNEGTAGEFHGIVYDGLFGDWSAYPHTLIQYATAGTQENTPDGEGALYLDGGTLYGHVESTMKMHLDQGGGEFTGAISICFNGNRDYEANIKQNVYPRLAAVSEDGTINWNPALKNLEDGTYEFYITDARAPFATEYMNNISDLEEHEQFFGKMKIVVGDTVDEMEFYLDLEQVATFLTYYGKQKIQASDLKTVEAQFGHIGQEWLSTAGASSGPYWGIAIAVVLSFGAAFLMRKRHKVVK